MLDKAFATRLAWAGWTYSFARGRKVYGLHIVVLLWTSFDGEWRIPVAFRSWRPKRLCSARRYRTKLHMAQTMFEEILGAGVPFRYVAFDTNYTADWFTRMLIRMDVEWVGTLDPRTIVFHRGRRQQVCELGKRLSLKWSRQLGLQATAVRVYALKYGDLRLVLTRNRYSNREYV